MDKKLDKPRTKEEQEAAYKKAWDYEPDMDDPAALKYVEEYNKRKNKK